MQIVQLFDRKPKVRSSPRFGFVRRPSTTISGLDSLDWNGGLERWTQIWRRKTRSQTFQGQEVPDISYKHGGCDGHTRYSTKLAVKTASVTHLA